MQIHNFYFVKVVTKVIWLGFESRSGLGVGPMVIVRDCVKVEIQPHGAIQVRNAVGGVSAFPEKSVTKVYGSMLLAL